MSQDNLDNYIENVKIGDKINLSKLNEIIDAINLEGQQILANDDKINNINENVLNKIEVLNEAVTENRENIASNNNKIDNLSEDVNTKIENINNNIIKVEENISNLEETNNTNFSSLEQSFNSKITNLQQNTNNTLTLLEQSFDSKINQVEVITNNNLSDFEQSLTSKIENFETNVSSKIENVETNITNISNGDVYIEGEDGQIIKINSIDKKLYPDDNFRQGTIVNNDIELADEKTRNEVKILYSLHNDEYWEYKDSWTLKGSLSELIPNRIFIYDAINGKLVFRIDKDKYTIIFDNSKEIKHIVSSTVPSSSNIGKDGDIWFQYI